MPKISLHPASTRGIHCHPLDPRLAIFSVRGDVVVSRITSERNVLPTDWRFEPMYPGCF